MAITYAAGAGTQIISYAVTETLGAQTQQTGNNTVILSDIPSNLGTEIGTGAAGTGPGDTYAGRVIVLNLGGVGEETRYCTIDAAGTGTTRILTVSEDWTTNPVVTTDTIDVFHTNDDIENGGSGGGVTFQTRTGVFEFSNELWVGNGTVVAGLQCLGELMEIEDSKSTTVFGFNIRTNGGRFQGGYSESGKSIRGPFMLGINNSPGEPWIDIASGGEGRFYNPTFISAVQPLWVQIASGADVLIDNFNMYRGSYPLDAYESTWTNGSITGSGTITDQIFVDPTSVFDNVVSINMNGFITPTGATGTTQTLELSNVTWVGTLIKIVVDSNKIWNVINPSWTIDIATQLDIDFLTATANSVNEKYSLDATVATADGTPLVGARVFLYEGLLTDNLDLELSADVNGQVSSSWIYITYTDNANTSLTTVTYGLHALRIFKYAYSPLVAAKSSNSFFDGVITLIPDTAISEQDQATAITNGAGILPVRHATGETDPRPMKVLNYDAGTGGLPVVGEIMTEGTATGVVVEYVGNAVAGTLVLETWNGTQFTDNQTISGGTGTFSATTDLVGFYEEYTWEIDCSSKSLQITYDYLAAEMARGGGSPVLLLPIFEQLHEWGKEQQGQAMYSGTNGYFTERAFRAGSPAVGEGVWLSNTGAGTIAYLTSDDGIQFSNVVVPILVQGVTEGAAVKVIANETVGTVVTGDVILEVLADSAGEAITSISYEPAFDPSGLDVITRARASGLPTAAIQDDNGVFTDETTAANQANTLLMNLLPTVPVAGEDSYLFGHPEKFGKVKLDINTAGTGDYTIVWQYWSGGSPGGWTDLSNVTDGTVGGSPLSGNSFSLTGLGYIEFDIPVNWALTTINTQGPYYYIRVAYTAGTVTVVPKGQRSSLDVQKYLPFVQNGIVTSSGLTVTASWVEDNIAKFKPI